MHEHHGLSSHPLYSAWENQKQRCYNPNNTAYKNYGRRGIYICDAWRNSFATFCAWAITNGWTPGLELDRIDNDGPYSPENCRFVTHKTNNNNKQHSLLITAFSETKCPADWEADDRCCVTAQTLRYRINAGWNTERAITEQRHRS